MRKVWPSKDKRPGNIFVCLSCLSQTPFIPAVSFPNYIHKILNQVTLTPFIPIWKKIIRSIVSKENHSYYLLCEVHFFLLLLFIWSQHSWATGKQFIFLYLHFIVFKLTLSGVNGVTSPLSYVDRYSSCLTLLQVCEGWGRVQRDRDEVEVEQKRKDEHKTLNVKSRKGVRTVSASIYCKFFQRVWIGGSVSVVFHQVFFIMSTWEDVFSSSWSNLGL